MLRKQIPFIPLGIFSGPQVLPNGRIFIPTGPPMYINSLSTVKKSVQTPLPFPDYAQVVVRSHSDRVNKDYTPEELGDYVHGGRCVQTSTDSAAVTVIAQTGIYNGESAGSVQLIFGYNKSDREPGFKDFAGHILLIAEGLLRKFEQDEISVSLYRAGAPYEAYKVCPDK